MQSPRIVDPLSFYGDPELGAVLWIRIGFNADLDPAFYFNEDLDPGSQTDADSCGSGSYSDFEVTKSFTYLTLKNDFLDQKLQFSYP